MEELQGRPATGRVRVDFEDRPGPASPGPARWERVFAAPPDHSTRNIALSLVELLACGGPLALGPLAMSIAYRAAYGQDPTTPWARRSDAALVVVGCLGLLGWAALGASRILA